ncbi:MAG: RDD family protein [Thermodesulfobacteriota bacterium]
MGDKRFGGFWRRGLAYVIDIFILYGISQILLFTGLLALKLGGISFRGVALTGDLPLGTGLFTTVYIVTMFLTGIVYFVWFHGTVGQTPGKMLLGLRVIQASGEKMNFGVAFLRWVGYLISGPAFLLGFIWIAFDGRKQGWHDKIAATLVIRLGNRVESGAHPAVHPPPTLQPPADFGYSSDDLREDLTKSLRSR